jgi:LysR family hydrogen peroxide-inducible transcriptional activator
MLQLQPSLEEGIKEIVLYFEPFVAYIPEGHQQFQRRNQYSDLNVDEIYCKTDTASETVY